MSIIAQEVVFMTSLSDVIYYDFHTLPAITIWLPM